MPVKSGFQGNQLIEAALQGVRVFTPFCRGLERKEFIRRFEWHSRWRIRIMNMNLSDLTTPQIIAIVAVVLIVAAVVVFALQKSRSARLRKKFGEAEYERAVAERGDRSRAEVLLEQRTKRVGAFHLRDLSPADRARFEEAWTRVQAHFVDGPAGAVTEADQLLGDVMATRGYPVGDFETRAADISVDHPEVTQNYRAAHEIAVRHLRGQATTEDLRRAMIHYRTLFVDLVGEPKDAVRMATATAPADYPASPSYKAR
jgi:hypothetical protein